MLETRAPPGEPTPLRDPGIPTLEAVLDPATITSHLRRVLVAERCPVGDVLFQVLKHHRGSRCTLGIDWWSEAGATCVIGKVYAAERFDLYRAMSDLRRVGFGAEHETSMPQPLAYVSELRLLLQEKVVGPRVKQIFATGDEDERAEAAERCGRWLAHFHALAPPVGQTSRLRDHLHVLEEWSRSLRPDLGARLADEASALCTRLLAAARGLEDGELRAGHGHYAASHIVLSRGPAAAAASAALTGLIGFMPVADDRTVAIDWDTYDVAEPLRDVARFMVELKRQGLKQLGSIDALDEVGDVFMRTYFSRSPAATREALPLFVATRCLHSALHSAEKGMRRNVHGWRESVTPLLDDGLSVLERGL